MAGLRKRLVYFQITCLLALFALPLIAQSGKRVWALRKPNEIVEYDPLTFAQRQVIKVPPLVLKNPKNLHINASGQMIFVPVLMGDPAAQDRSSEKLWFWNGRAAMFLERGVSRTSTPAGDNCSQDDSSGNPWQHRSQPRSRSQRREWLNQQPAGISQYPLNVHPHIRNVVVEIL